MKILLVDIENELNYSFNKLDIININEIVAQDTLKYFVGLEDYVEGKFKLPLSKYKSVAKCISFDYAINIRKNMKLIKYDFEIAYGGLSELVFTACGNSKVKIAIISEFNHLPKISIEGLKKLFDRFEYIFTINEETYRLLCTLDNIYYLNDLSLIEDKICEIVKKDCK